MDMNNTTTKEDEKDLAQTPWWFIKALENFLGVSFNLDVCALEETAKCFSFYSLEDGWGGDGLVCRWSEYNWCNPPYSDIKPWVNRAIEEARVGKITAMLIPDKPETAISRHARFAADTVIHMPFRLNFIRPNGEQFLDKKGKKQGPKFPVMVVLITPWGLNMPVRDVYIDFREYGYDT